MRVAILIVLCATMALSFPIIGGDDHDKIAHQVIELNKYLGDKSVEDLRAYCLKLEEYVRTKKGDHSTGGIHDYVWRLDAEGCKNYIFSVAMNHKELLDRPKFESTVEPEELVYLEEAPTHGGLHDYIFRLDHETLVAFAFSAEKYVVEKKGTGMIFGGLHDMIQSMKDSEIAEYILKQAANHKELDSYDMLMSLSMEYGFIFPEADVLLLENIDGGLHDYIWRQSRETLVNWALTAEFHEREVKKMHLMGGLHDYIDTLDNSEIADYILKKAKSFPELNSASGLNELQAKYGISYVPHHH